MEEGSLPIIHYRRTGPSKSVPMVVSSDGLLLRDSSHIMRWCHLGAPAGWKAGDDDAEAESRVTSMLYPNGRTQEIVALEQQFDDKLGPHIRRWAYWQIFKPNQPPMRAAKLLSAGAVHVRCKC